MALPEEEHPEVGATAFVDAAVRRDSTTSIQRRPPTRPLRAEERGRNMLAAIEGLIASDETIQRTARRATWTAKGPEEAADRIVRHYATSPAAAERSRRRRPSFRGWAPWLGPLAPSP